MNIWKIDWEDTAARAYAAAVFDEDGEVKVTQGEAIVRMEIGATRAQVPVLGNLYARAYKCQSFLSGIQAQRFLQYIAPYVVCKKEQVCYALGQWCKRNEAKRKYLKLIKDSAKGMPKVKCVC